MATLFQQVSKVEYYPPSEDGLRFESLQRQDASKSLLPAGFPDVLKSPLAWTRSEIEAQEDKWYLVLSEEDINDIDKALRHFQGLGLFNPSEVSVATFPLPEALAQRLDRVSEQCHSDIGFCIVRGLDPDKYSENENVLVFAGISFYVAPQRGFQDQNKSQVVCHIKQKATNKTSLTTKATPVFTEGAMVFHTDAGELLSLYTVEVDQAGRGRIASSWQAYNELAGARPDIVHELAKPWVMDTYSDYTKHPPRTIPLLSYEGDKMIVFCSRYPFTGFGANKRNPSLPPITQAQIEALNALHFVADKNSITLDNRKGDILYLNNMSCLHGREALKVPIPEGVEVEEAKMSPRHRIRFFLRDPERAWKLPAEVVRVWEDIYGKGFAHEQKEELWVLDEEGLKNNRWQFNG